MGRGARRAAGVAPPARPRLMTSRLFAYGTLRDEHLVERLLGRRLPWQPAVLEGYCRTLDASIGYPIVHPLAGASVDGRLLDGVDQTALAALDAYEGPEYRRSPCGCRRATAARSMPMPTCRCRPARGR